MSLTSNEYTQFTIEASSVTNLYPERGSVGVYLHEISSRISKSEISLTAFKMFFIIASDVNEFGQTTRSRREIAEAMCIKYDHSRMSKLIKELVDNEWIAMFDNNVITVSPFLMLPMIKEPKFKSAMQDAWRHIVEYEE